MSKLTPDLVLAELRRRALGHRQRARPGSKHRRAHLRAARRILATQTQEAQP